MNVGWTPAAATTVAFSVRAQRHFSQFVAVRAVLEGDRHPQAAAQLSRAILHELDLLACPLPDDGGVLALYPQHACPSDGQLGPMHAARLTGLAESLGLAVVADSAAAATPCTQEDAANASAFALRWHLQLCGFSRVGSDLARLGALSSQPSSADVLKLRISLSADGELHCVASAHVFHVRPWLGELTEPVVVLPELAPGAAVAVLDRFPDQTPLQVANRRLGFGKYDPTTADECAGFWRSAHGLQVPSEGPYGLVQLEGENGRHLYPATCVWATFSERYSLSEQHAGRILEEFARDLASVRVGGLACANEARPRPCLVGLQRASALAPSPPPPVPVRERGAAVDSAAAGAAAKKAKKAPAKGRKKKRR